MGAIIKIKSLIKSYIDKKKPVSRRPFSTCLDGLCRGFRRCEDAVHRLHDGIDEGDFDVVDFGGLDRNGCVAVDDRRGVAVNLDLKSARMEERLEKETCERTPRMTMTAPSAPSLVA